MRITGYADTVNGVTYCPDCVDESDKEELTPIYDIDEWDAPGPSCDTCLELIEINPIHYEDENDYTKTPIK